MQDDENQLDDSTKSTETTGLEKQNCIQKEILQHGEEKTTNVITAPIKIFYQHRDILDLSYLREPKGIVQFTVLPENNVNCFFQNRAQYWRLSISEPDSDKCDKCHCCEFTYPSSYQSNQRATTNENAITDSLLAFLKSFDMSTQQPQIKHLSNNVQRTHLSQSQQHLPPNTNNSLYNYNQSLNPFLNSGTTLALLNIMNNASKNAASAFQVMSNNPSHYYNNVNNNFGLYQQF